MPPFVYSLELFSASESEMVAATFELDRLFRADAWAPGHGVVPLNSLTGSAASSLALSPRLQRLLSLGVLDSNEGWDCWKIGRKKNASAGPGLPTVAARVGREDDRSTVGRAHAHVEAPLSA